MTSPENKPEISFFEESGSTITKETYDQAQTAFMRELHDSLRLLIARAPEQVVYELPTAE